MVERAYTDDSQNLDYRVPNGGVYVFDAWRISGDLVLTLQSSYDDGTTFVNYYDKDGILQQATGSASLPHVHFEVLARKNQVFRVVSSGKVGTPNYKAIAGLAARETTVDV